jgi:hypothetical protein
VGDAFTDSDKEFRRSQNCLYKAGVAWDELEKGGGARTLAALEESFYRSGERSLVDFILGRDGMKIVPENQFEYAARFKTGPVKIPSSTRFIVDRFGDEAVSTLHYFASRGKDVVVARKGEILHIEEKECVDVHHWITKKRIERQEIDIDDFVCAPRRDTYLGSLSLEQATAQMLDLKTGRIYLLSSNKHSDKRSALQQLKMTYAGFVQRTGWRAGERFLLRDMETAGRYLEFGTGDALAQTIEDESYLVR